MPSTFELIRRDLRQAQEYAEAALSRIHNYDISEIPMENLDDAIGELRGLQRLAALHDMKTKPYR